jgi:uncharacterized peroxidase-related enzyme
MSDMNLQDDLIDSLVPLHEGEPAYVVRRQRDKVVDATQACLQAVFDPALPGLTLGERFAAAARVAELSGGAALAQWYRQQLASTQQPAKGARLDAILEFSATLATKPVEGDRDAILKLPAAGLATADVVTLGQLIALVAFQVRVIAGLKALAQEGQADTTPPQVEDEPFVHPANLPPPGEPLRIQGYTSATLGWTSWLPTLPLEQATPRQLEVLKQSHPKATTSQYYMTLIWQPEILEQRSIVFNAIMYAPGGLSRAERELASTVVSRVNGCVYCGSVHAQRFEQLAKRNDVIAQVFEEPATAGTNARERAIVQASIALTQDAAGFGAAQLAPLRAAGLTSLEILDWIHAVAIFAWANRLMQNLGEPAEAGN